MAVWMYKDLDGMNDLDRKKIRSKTFPGIAAAMAEQWSGLKDSPTTMKGFFTKRTFY